MNKKKIIVFLLIMMFISGCSSSAASQSQEDDAAASSGNSGFVIEPKPDEDDSYSIDTYGQETVDADGLWIPEDDDGPDVSDISEYDFDVSKLNFEEFDNLYGEVMYIGVPEGRVSQPLKQANGVWRYNLKIRRDSSTDGYMFDELGYAVMSVDGNNDPPIIITLHPRLAAYDGYEVYTQTDEEVGYEPFKGTLDDDNVVRLYGNDLILIPEYFYAYEGREYFIAHLYKGEEFFADFLMIRGQE